MQFINALVIIWSKNYLNLKLNKFSTSITSNKDVKSLTFLLEERRDLLDEADCSSAQSSLLIRGGRVSRLMIARLNQVSNAEVGDAQPLDYMRPRVNYFNVRQEQYPFPDSSLLDAPDCVQSDEVKEEIAQMVHVAVEDGFLNDHLTDSKKIVSDHMEIFRTSLSHVSAADVPTIKVDLFPDAKPVKVRLRNYSQDQREFLFHFFQKLVSCGMAYSNPSSAWACAPLLVPKPGLSKLRFTVDLRPVNTFTVKHQFPIPSIGQELMKLADSKKFATFDFSQGYR